MYGMGTSSEWPKGVSRERVEGGTGMEGATGAWGCLGVDEVLRDIV